MRRRRRYRSSYDREEFDMKDFLSEVGHWAISILVVVILAYSIVTFGMQTVTMIGQSMNPALSSQDVLLLNKAAYTFSSPKRYDIVAFKLKDDSDGYFTIKRIVGLPGETVQIKDGTVYINGKEQKKYIHVSEIKDAGIASDEIKLGKDEYFVLGDNEESGEDSRSETVGVVKADEIYGKVWFNVSSGEHFGFVKR